MNISTSLNARKLLLSILSIASLGANAQNVTIPDANFKAYLVGNTAINTGGDPNEIELTEAAAFTGGIYCNSLSISDLTGIEAFTAITSLWCHTNSLTSLNLTQNIDLADLICHTNQLTSLNLPQNTDLFRVICRANQLTSLNLSQNTGLTTLECANNPLTNLNLTQNTLLTDLKCNNNSITSLNLSQNTLLTVLKCYNNGLTSLNVIQNTNLSTLWCHNNSITSLSVIQNTALTQLYCNKNSLTNLDVTLNTALTDFNCADNLLTSLNVANGNNANTTYFNASNNPNLTCITVDNVAYSTTNWTTIDAASSFGTNCATVGINETSQNIDLNIYPNPTTGKVSFSTTEQISSIEIYNLTGQKVATFNNVDTIDISNLPKGIYAAKVKYTNGSVTKKLIKE